MKKLIFTFMLGIGLISCCNCKTTIPETTDTTMPDTTAVDTVMVDSVAIDSIL